MRFYSWVVDVHSVLQNIYIHPKNHGAEQLLVFQRQDDPAKNDRLKPFPEGSLLILGSNKTLQEIHYWTKQLTSWNSQNKPSE